MVRSFGIIVVVGGLAWTGLAGAQSYSSPPGTEASPPRFMTVREEGKPPQRCQLLKSWREANGQSAFQVRAVDSGELMTIVGSTPQGVGGDSRSLPTRIFHWGGDNKSPLGAPLPPPTAANLPTKPSLPLNPAPISQSFQGMQTARTPNLSPAPLNLAPTSQPIQGSLTARTPDVTPAPRLTSLPATVQPKPVASANPPSLTPMGTPIIPQKPSALPTPLNAAAQPRLTPAPSGTVVNQTPCDCACPSPCAPTCKSCETCSHPPCDCACPSPCGSTCKPCETCSQPSCICCPPSPMRQSFISRLFKPKSCCVCTETVCPAPTAPVAAAPPASAPAVTPPAPVVVKAPPAPTAPTAPPAARDSRESWGKVEPWKAPPSATIAKPAEKVTQRIDPVPVELEKPSQPSPLQNPGLYREMAMNRRIKNSKIVETKPVVAPPASVDAPTGPAIPPPTSRAGRSVDLPANEANAFWSPPAPPTPPAEGPKFNAFDRSANSPPQANPRVMVNPPQGPVPPRGPMPMLMPPSPPMPPMPPPMADVGVAEAMGNAFTLAGTRRPIPADFGGTPQEPNGFGDAVPQAQGQGSPPRAYGMAMPGMQRPTMPNPTVMAARMPIGANPLMSVPPTPIAPPAAVAARPKTAPQLMTTLKESLFPSEREWAAEQLSEQTGPAQPQVVQSLMQSAKDDPAATVRASCVHALAHMKVGSKEVAALVQSLKADRDPRVRHEAEEAFETLGLAATVPIDTGIQPASHHR